MNNKYLNKMKTNTIDFKSASDKYFEGKGFTEAQECNGKFPVFQSWLPRIQSNIAQESASNVDQEGKRQNDYSEKLDELKTRKKSAEEEVTSIEKTVVQNKKKDIETAKDDIQDIQSDPKRVLSEQYTDGKGGKGFDAFVFTVGIVILLGLTVYLFQFYVAGGYSAFFRDMGAELADESQIALTFNAIFYPNTLSEATAKGCAVFVLCFPFAFFAFGFGVHILLTYGRKVAAILLTLLILGFDVLLAHEIIRKVHDIKLMEGLVHEEWKSGMLFTSPEFYLIITAGFAIYMIWGFLLGFVLEQNSMRKPLVVALRRKQQHMETLQRDIDEATARADDLSKQIKSHDAEIQRLETLLNNYAYFDFQRFIECISSFTVGWTSFLGSEISPDMDQRIQEVKDFATETIANMRNASQ